MSECQPCPNCEPDGYFTPMIVTFILCTIITFIASCYSICSSKKSKEIEDPYQMTTRIGLNFYRDLYAKLIRHETKLLGNANRGPAEDFFCYFTDLYEYDSKVAAHPGENRLLDKHRNDQRTTAPISMHNRVKLIGHDRWHDDFVHANIVDYPNGLKMIMTGGPQPDKPVEKDTKLKWRLKAEHEKQSDIVKFWWMAKQEGVEEIVMLSNQVEHGVVQCDEYYPSDVDQEKTFDSFRLNVTCIDKKDIVPRRIVQRKLSIKFKFEPKFYVTHYELKNWGEVSYVRHLDMLYVLLYEIRTSRKPVIVHCIDGVGRTGCFGFVEMGFQVLKREGDIDFGDVLDYMRSKRAGVVTSAKEYGFCAYMLAYYIFIDKIQNFKNPDDKLMFEHLTKGFEGWNEVEKRVAEMEEKRIAEVKEQEKKKRREAAEIKRKEEAKKKEADGMKKKEEEAKKKEGEAVEDDEPPEGSDCVQIERWF